MKKTIYFHIGGRKTGTTAIQKFLSLNREQLKKMDCLYPGSPVEVHHEITHAMMDSSVQEIKSNTVIQKYINEIERTECTRIIISAEGLESLAGKVPVLKEAFSGYAIKIIFYVRRQDDRIESNYNQAVKEISYRSPHTFTQFLGNGYKNILDYYEVLLPWRDAFGIENIIVRCYEKEQLNKDIYQDFLQAAGLNMDTTFIFPKGIVNPSLDWDLIEMIRLLNIKFPDDKKLFTYTVNNLEKINMNYKTTSRRLLSPQQRHQLIELYNDSNQKVAREFLGRENGILFYAPLPDLNEPWQAYESLTVEKIVPIFTQLMFAMERRQRTQARAPETWNIRHYFITLLKKIGARSGTIKEG